MKGNFSIGSYMNDRNETVVIELEDTSSHVQFLKITTNKLDLMRALMGLHGVDCTFELRGIDAVGKIRETKMLAVPFDDPDYNYHKMTDEELHAYLVPFEVDGWVGSIYDMKNSNNRNYKNNTINIHFTRFIDPPQA